MAPYVASSGGGGGSHPKTSTKSNPKTSITKLKDSNEISYDVISTKQRLRERRSSRRRDEGGGRSSENSCGSATEHARTRAYADHHHVPRQQTQSL